MAMAHSKKNACMLIDDAKFNRVEHHEHALSVDVTQEGSMWWDLTFSPFTPIEFGAQKATYLNGFVYMWCNHNKSHIRIKVAIRPKSGRIRPDWLYFITIGDFTKEQSVKYKEQDQSMRSMLLG